MEKVVVNRQSLIPRVGDASLNVKIEGLVFKVRDCRSGLPVKFQVGAQCDAPEPHLTDELPGIKPKLISKETDVVIDISLFGRRAGNRAVSGSHRQFGCCQGGDLIVTFQLLQHITSCQLKPTDLCRNSQQYGAACDK